MPVPRTVSSHSDRLVLESEDRLELHGLDLRLDPDTVPASKDLVVRAYRVELTGVLALPGRRVDISARTVVSRGATIDTSGADGRPHAAPAPSGGSTAAGGGAGAVGHGGGDGGAVRIVCEEIEGTLVVRSNGGSGGRGQRGGDGAPGGAGGQGRDAELRNTGYGPDRGGTGGAGGAAGPGGRGGDGGNAGVVEIRTLRPGPSVRVAAIAGPAGPAEENGAPGGGGPGGIGGRNRRCDYEPPEKHGGRFG